ncbi:hypothetical protein AMATHDRAFT_59144 [Amanita thiersii Skay4041]|uniref:GTP cyclohydrolase II n=1 Tax=Amanita thiersii Skay4041 TaxID=703135 RepID=A0A2A9NK98_9AGAR|nr:hypothetical protein AMATHDRAFT_59144 [Amanita thiersii Skay4041]
MPARILQHTHVHRDFDKSSDDVLLDLLTAPTPPNKATFVRRDAALDPLLIAVAAASGPHVTRNHYHHDFFPTALLPPSDGLKDLSKRPGEDLKADRRRLAYVSRQAPRRQRLQGLLHEGEKENDRLRETDSLKSVDNLPPIPKKRRSFQSISSHAFDAKNRISLSTNNDTISLLKSPRAPLEVKCMARTRIPTPHGPVFLHLYHNNHDDKEHLAIVVDPVQLSENSGSFRLPPIRSSSLDAVWSENETEMDRVVRGAYVGRLSPSSIHAGPTSAVDVSSNDALPPPLIRIHSECFTGETVGSMRCDCGEQLDEAIRQISQPITIGPSTIHPVPVTIHGRGAVVYLRQEGRGIGLLSKIRAYNLQDLGHDTVTANLLLGYKADERGYGIAAAILHDLGLGSSTGSDSEGVRVLTNNPDKVEALRKEGIKVVDRVAMIPRSWQQRAAQKDGNGPNGVVAQGQEKVIGATLIGGNAVHGDDLDKYLKTKVLRMGHMLPLWMEE